MKILIRQLVLIVATLLVSLVNSLAEDKHIIIPPPPEIRFPVICTVEKLASISPDAIVDDSNRMLFKIEKKNQILDVKVIGGIKGNKSRTPLEGHYKILEHSYYVNAEKRDSSYREELTLTRDHGNVFGHGTKALILKVSYHSYASVGAAAGICNEK